MPAKSLSISIPWAAQGKARPVVNTATHRAITPKPTKGAEMLVGLYGRNAMRANGYGTASFTGPLAMRIVATYKPPKSWSDKRRREAVDSHEWKLTKPDADNVAKLVADALNGIVYADDNAITRLEVVKLYGNEDETAIYIHEIRGGSAADV